MEKLTKKSRIDLAHLPDKLHHKTKKRAKRMIEDEMGVASSKKK